jgi:predicted nucleotidyltransferase component of viral defense system
VIERAEILALATDLSLAPEVVEKDYVLGWLLSGIYGHDQLASAWVFKGGTCLKKCYFETYRFSEDLDFTITDVAQLDEIALKSAFTEIAEQLYDELGLEIPADQLRFEIYRNKRDGLSCEGRIYYRGPLRRVASLARIKLDLTADEVLVAEPVEREVGHPYTDRPDGGIFARCYSYEEMFAEKVRALAERTRPRDLYDVINLFRHEDFRPAAEAVFVILRRKCEFKAIAVPTLAELSSATEELIGDWDAMLRHQLPVLPPFENYWSALPSFFSWLEGAVEPVPLATAPIGDEESVFRPAFGALRREGVGGSSFLETVRFAAANHLCVDLGYQGSVRRIEPYSLRRSRAGDILLFAVKAESGESRSYRLDRIERATATMQSFAPRYAVELTPSEAGPIPRLSQPRSFQRNHPRPSGRLGRRGAPRLRQGPLYVYQCRRCGKRFQRSSRSAALRPHKTPHGRDCPGRTGYLVDTKY